MINREELGDKCTDCFLLSINAFWASGSMGVERAVRQVERVDRPLCLFQTLKHSRLGLRREQGSAVTGFQKGLLCQVVIDLASLVNVHSGPIIAQSVQRCGLISTICRIDKNVSTNTH